VTSYLDLTGLLPAGQRRQEDAVLNGIAYDPATRRIFVGGKLWPTLFQIRVY
jgi:glutamine cyclotransferase